MVRFRTQSEWTKWLRVHHGSSHGVWLAIGKKEAGERSLTYSQALESALCYGWIDGQKAPYDDAWWLQRFTPRGERSIWSKQNRVKAEELLRNGKMRRPGLKAIEAARKSGQWARAYASQKTMEMPADLRSALKRNSTARAFFETLNSANRYSILFRIHAARKPETRRSRIEKFVAMLERKEKIHQ